MEFHSEYLPIDDYMSPNFMNPFQMKNEWWVQFPWDFQSSPNARSDDERSQHHNSQVLFLSSDAIKPESTLEYEVKN